MAKLPTPLKALNLEFRIFSTLYGEGIRYVEDLVKLSDHEIMAMPGLGRKHLNQIKAQLHAANLHLTIKKLKEKPMTISQAKISAAFSIAQSKFKNPKKNVSSGEGEFKSAPLSAFFNAVRKSFRDNGLYYRQTLATDSAAGKITVKTIVGHESGESFESEPLELKYDKDNFDLVCYQAKLASFKATMGLTGEDEVEEGVKREIRSNYASAGDRRLMKQNMLNDIKKVFTENELTNFTKTYEAEIQKMSDEDPTYVSDIISMMGEKKKYFDSLKDNLTGRI